MQDRRHVVRTHPVTPPRQPTGNFAIQWEYQTEIGEFEESNEFVAKLDELGTKGWAVSMTADLSGDHYTVLLKREKKAES